MQLTGNRCRVGAAALALFIIGGCQQKAPSAQEILEQASHLEAPLPGLYRSETRLEAFALPGASRRDAQLLRRRMAGVQPQVAQSCLTPEQARQGFAPLVQQLQQGDCRFDSFVANSGQMRAELHCTAPGGVLSHVQMEGTGAASGSSMRLTIEQRGPAIPGGLQTMTLNVASRRVGRC